MPLSNLTQSQQEHIRGTMKEIRDRVQRLRERVDEKYPAVPSPRETATLERTTTNIGGVDFEIPKELADYQMFKEMPEEQRAMLAQMYITVADQGQDLGRFLQALETAADQSDIYMGQQMRMFKDEMARTFTHLGEDLEAQEELASLRKRQLEEDLERSKERLSIDQQKDLSDIAKQYEGRITEIRSQIEERGLSRSSIRNRAQEKLAEVREDMAESTTMKYERQREDLRTQVQRQIQDIDRELFEQRIQTERSAGEIARTGEKTIGTEGMRVALPQMGIGITDQDWMPDDWMVGGITATKEKEQRFTDITGRMQAFMPRIGT